MILWWYKRKLDNLFAKKNKRFREDSVILYSQIYNHKNEKIRNLWNVWMEKSTFLEKEDLDIDLNIMQVDYNKKCLENFLSEKEQEFYNPYIKTTHIQRVLLKLISLGQTNELFNFLKNEKVDDELKLHIIVDIALKEGSFADYYKFNGKELFSSLKIQDDYLSFFNDKERFDTNKLYHLLEYYGKNVFTENCDPSTLYNHAKPYLYIENILIERDMPHIGALLLPKVLINNRRQILLTHFYESNPNDLYKILYSILKKSFNDKYEILEGLLDNLKQSPLSDLKIVKNQKLNIDKFLIADLINNEPNYQINESNLKSRNLTTKKFWFLEGTDYYDKIEKYELTLHLEDKLKEKNIKTKINKI